VPLFRRRKLPQVCNSKVIFISNLSDLNDKSIILNGLLITQSQDSVKLHQYLIKAYKNYSLKKPAGKLKTLKIFESIGIYRKKKFLVHLFADGGTCTLNTFPQTKPIKAFEFVHQQCTVRDKNIVVRIALL
jgi:hypothetical protein